MITVIIPFANKKRVDNLRRCLEVVDSQSLLANEIIIFYYGERPEIKQSEIIERSLVMVNQSEDNFELTWARNKALTHMSTKYICFLDCDLLLSKHALRDAVAVLRDTQAGIVGFPCIHLNKDGDRLPRAHWSGKILSGGCQIMETKDFKAVGGFNPFIIGWGFEDQDLVKRMSEKGLEPHIIQTPYLHLWHESSHDLEKMRLDEACNIGISENSRYDGEYWNWNGYRMRPGGNFSKLQELREMRYGKRCHLCPLRTTPEG
jgi:glycosyltransferase involved in cell wall biosynthesis